MTPDPRKDDQTGLPNALAFLEALSLAATRPERAALFLLDLGGGTQGPTDAAVAAMADTLSLRPGVTAFRFGRERFAVLAAGSAAPAPQVLGEEILAAYRGTAAPAGADPTCRIGHAALQGPFRPAGLLSEAGAALGADPPDGQGLVDDLIRRMGDTLGQMQTEEPDSPTDPISGLPSHRHMRRVLGATVASAAEAGGSAAVIFVDGDHLRRYNEISHEAGNAMLRRLGAVQRRSLRGQDTVGRWLSGDEFLIVLPGADRTQALACAQRLCEAVRRESASWEVKVTISAGVAVFPTDGRTGDTLLRAALAACAAAKRGGKDRVFLAADLK